MTTDTLLEPNNLQERLAAHPFVKDMEPHHIEVLSESAEERRFARDEVIFRAGEPATGFFLIESGAVAIEAPKHLESAVIIDTVHAGEPLGWSWLFEPYLWEFSARATEPTKALYFSREHLWEHHEEDLTLGHDLFRRMSQVMVRRLQAARRKLAVGRQSSHTAGASA